MKAIITVGMGFGDEGKGSCVDFLVREFHADLVVRYNGGHQAAHHVVLPGGREHTFSQFGSGTLAGVRTYLGRNVIIEPMALEKEAEALTKLGIYRPKDKLSINEDCLVTTAWHRFLNQAKELARGGDKDGSCGVGIGETRKYWLDYGDDSITAKDLVDYSGLVKKLELVRQRMLLAVTEVHREAKRDDEDILDLMKAMHNLRSADVARRLVRGIEGVVITNLMPRFDTAIFEGAQGILLDEYYGFYPHTTWSTTTSRHAFEELQGLDVDITTLGIIRAHASRHGAGPLPTELVNLAFDEKSNPYNPWQGRMRYGNFDLPLATYAKQVDGNIDGFFMTHNDNQVKNICSGYMVRGSKYPHDTDGLARSPSLVDQEENGIYLDNVVVGLTNNLNALAALSSIGPVIAVSDGPTWKDKAIIKRDRI